MNTHLRLTVFVGCLVAVPSLATVMRGDAEPADPPSLVAKRPAAAEPDKTTPDKTTPDKTTPDRKALDRKALDKKDPAEERPVKKLDPKRAALGPVCIDRMPPPVVPRNKRYARLPPYYSEVVNEKQRQHIYAIQRLFGPKLEEYKLKYEALKTQRDEKIEQVLTPEQKAQVEQFKLAAKAKRAGGKQ